MDRRAPSGVGRRAGRILPGAPDRSKSHGRGARRPAAEARPVRREPRDSGTARGDRRARGITGRARDRVSRDGQDAVRRSCPRSGSRRSCARWPAATPRSRATLSRSCARRRRRKTRRPICTRRCSASRATTRPRLAFVSMRWRRFVAASPRVGPGPVRSPAGQPRTGAAGIHSGRGRGVVEKAQLDREQLFTLAERLEKTGPLELPRLLPAFDNAGDEALGLEMMAALERRPADRACAPTSCVRDWRSIRSPCRSRERRCWRRSTSTAAKQTQRLEELLGALKDGDIRRGQAVFNGPKTACMSCHAIGYLGGKIGPDLTRIGQIRSERDLLEAIVYPNASFARGYESVIVTTTSGAMHSGVLRSDLPDEVVLATNAGEESADPAAGHRRHAAGHGLGHAARVGRTAHAAGAGRSSGVPQSHSLGRAIAPRMNTGRG